MDDGIYFGLPMDDYRAIPRLSPHGIMNLRVSAGTFWAESWLNPHPKELTDEQRKRQEIAMLLGEAYHCARLEPDQFEVRFCRQLEQSDFDGVPGFVAGGTAYGDALGELEQAKKKGGESVTEQAQRLLAAGYDKGPIWHVELAKWDAERGERCPIPGTAWDEILQDMDRIARVPDIHALLSDGAAEVAILWTCAETGLPMKTRLDYLRWDGWADFKTYANAVGKHVQNAITDSFKFNRYHLQAAVQRDAVLAIRDQSLEIRSPDPSRWQHEVVAGVQLADDEPVCHFIWQEKGGIPNLWARKLRFYNPSSTAEAVAQLEADGASDEHLARARHFAEIADSTPSPSRWFYRAQREVAAAKADFRLYSEVYKPGEPWMPFDPVGELTDLDFNQHWLDGEH